MKKNNATQREMNQHDLQKICRLLEVLSLHPGEAFIEYAIDSQTRNCHPMVVHLTRKSAVLRDGTIVPLSNTSRLKSLAKCPADPKQLSQLNFSFHQVKTLIGILSNKVQIIDSGQRSIRGSKKLNKIREKILKNKARLGLKLKSSAPELDSSEPKKVKTVTTNLSKVIGSSKPPSLKELREAARRKEALEKTELVRSRTEKKELRNKKLTIGSGTIPISVSTLAPGRSNVSRAKKKL